MIRSDAEYREAAERIKDEKKRITAEKQKLEEEGLTAGEIKRALDPLRSFHQQLEEEVEGYERLKRGEFGEVLNFQGIGRMLIAIRIFRGLSQRELAKTLEVDESQVSRDERNEYNGVTVERAARIIDALGFSVRTTVEPSPSKAA